MPCSDSSSGLNFRVDSEERLITFEFAKITCSREIGGGTGYTQFCRGQRLQDILKHDFVDLVRDLKIESDEEKQFILHLEWEALRCGIAEYLGVDDPMIDSERCQISSIESTPEYVEVAEVILPPRELPKILPCSLADRKNSKQ